MSRFARLFQNEKVILAIYLLIALITYLQCLALGKESYNNFTIFREAFFHLLNHQNLHLEYPELYYDIFLYTPAFTIFFLPFSLPPVSVGLLMWLLFSAWFSFWAIQKLLIQQSYKVFMWWFCLLELNTSLHNVQTNSSIAALGLLTFAFLERRLLFWAALCPAIAFCIKGYGVIVVLLYLFYPQKIKTGIYFALCLAGLMLLPLPFIGLGRWLEVYQEWYQCLQADRKVNIGLGVMGVLNAFFPGKINVALIQIISLVCLIVTTGALYWFSAIAQQARLRWQYLAYLLIWVIIFNHAAESASYIIAISGVAVWYVFSDRTFIDKFWVYFVFFFSILAPFDVYPSFIRSHFFGPYCIKAIGCIGVCCLLQFYLLKQTKLWHQASF
ncbi:glycosyltransferase family 87 protein [Runella sp. MFBS21]|uniref:glycosyltransferase family 87 protein n=1 Tax=Runella sp. MFBS21 TaxID=3034018 RepID=UPI0023F7616E|nr:glycosyltransferase family 87 protein [Runella sp. MFBS21]MDF7821110.1 glycosyltransferase family 87 protein [Runella sp. MFBS21]